MDIRLIIPTTKARTRSRTGEASGERDQKTPPPSRRRRLARSSADVLLVERSAALVRRLVTLTSGTILSHRDRFEQVVRGSYLGAQVEIAVNAHEGSTRVCIHRGFSDGLLVLGCNLDFKEQVEVQPGVFRLVHDSGSSQRTWACLSDILREDLCDLIEKTDGYLRWIGTRIEFGQPKEMVLRDDAVELVTHILELGAILSNTQLPELL